MPVKSRLLVSLLTLTTVLSASFSPALYTEEADEAQQADAAPQPPQRSFPCEDDPRHHAFDFWIGEWTVTVNGEFAGNNTIQPLLGHCTLFEQWRGASGSNGKSFNYYDPAHDHWRQIWISDGGAFIEFTGEARDGGIFYTAETINPQNGNKTLHKFEFTQPEPDVVRQFWQISQDEGENWQVIWDGRYERTEDT